MDLSRTWAEETGQGAEKKNPYEGNRFDEQGFQDWYGRWSEVPGLDPTPDAKEHKYDYRKAYQAGAAPTFDENVGSYNWPSEFKASDLSSEWNEASTGATP